MNTTPIRSALVSVYCKDGIADMAAALCSMNVQIYSTGGTLEYLRQCGISAIAVEDLTGYPSILGGRVKTLHPNVFGGILARRSAAQDMQQLTQYDMPAIDAVIVDLYPFEETIKTKASNDDIIEKIDIGGISLIRAAAKNYADVAVVASRSQYNAFIQMLQQQNGGTTLEQRRMLAAHAFNISSHYDAMIFNYFNDDAQIQAIKHSYLHGEPLRYGENPHQQACFYGSLHDTFERLHGKEISYNNLLDIEAGMRLVGDFNATVFAILKHNNACGIAERESARDAYLTALECDPVSAFGGVLVCNTKIDAETAQEIGALFFEVMIAPAYSDAALEILMQKKNRILLRAKTFSLPPTQCRTLLGGMVWQRSDMAVETAAMMQPMTRMQPTAAQLEDLVFANKVVKHSKSNAIVLAKDRRLLSSGIGQTSRVDALRQAIEKAQRFGFSLHGAVMASDAFFPFADCVEIAHQCGIAAIVQPGGSLRDADSINYCNNHAIAMLGTGVRHFKH
jgi:phosphoribosylaminoimidazolecarboxamide formyltransferase/IMP cyclohydrolase